MYQQDDLLPYNRNYTLLIGCFTILFSILIISVTFNSIRTQKPESDQSNTIVEDTTQRKADLTKYNQDSDKDLIPNFIEEEAILNTYIAESSYCEQSNPVCARDPFDKQIYLSILIDSSTSTNIPATGNTTKLELIKSKINNLIGQSFNKEYIKTQVVGFGNKGNVSFIADNESCVSNIIFKDFNQEPKDTSVVPLILERYVSNGKSPIGLSLEQVEKTFPDKNGDNIVVIVTDGTDDCGVDLKSAFRGVLNRGVVKKIHVVSIFSPQDEKDKLKDAAESNGGKFTENQDINNFILSWVNDYLFENWCRQPDLNKIYQCLDRNYNSAIQILDKQINANSPQNEINKVGEIKSSINFYIQNYINDSKFDSEKIFKEAIK